MIQDISFSVFEEPDSDEVADLLSESFCRFDPIEIALNITPVEFREMVCLELPIAARSGMSLIARSATAKSLLGVMIASDAVAEHVDSARHISPKFRPVSQLVGKLYDDYVNEQKFNRGEALYLFMIAVNPEYQGLGIAKMLVRKTLALAESRGYKHAFTAATNIASCNVFLSQNFKTIKMVKYQDYYYEGNAVFASITEHPGVALMEYTN